MRIRPPPLASRSSRDASPTEALITAAVLATLAAACPAQRQFDELRKRGLPSDNDPTFAVALGDVDGDGDLDVVVANGGLYPYYSGRQNRLYLNDGDGTGTYTDATATRMPVDNDQNRAVALGDVDGDGDLDIVFASGYRFGARNRLYLNDGTGTFTDATATHLPADNDNTVAVALGDIDGDGDLDLVFGNGGYAGMQPDRLYLNNGTGTFTDASAARLPPRWDTTQTVALGDVDGDGDLDMVLGNGSSYYSEQNRLYLNDGSGTYTDATATHLPVVFDETSAVALGDVDRDGDLDIVFGRSGGQSQLYLNRGTGAFADATAARMPRFPEVTHAVGLGDVDGDGDLDLVFGNGLGFNGSRQSRLYLNDGTGTFTNATLAQLPADNNTTRSVALGDVDSDGDLDMVLGNTGHNRLYLNDGSAIFSEASAARMPADYDLTAAVALGDVDGDGDLDMVLGHDDTYRSGGEQNRLYLNDGTSTYTDATAARMPVDRDLTSSVALGDVDGDGDLDVVFGNGSRYGGQQNRLYLNDGSATFTDATTARLPVHSDNTGAVALGDVDGDGDLDIVVGNGYLRGAQNRLYLNDGSATFIDATAARMPAVRGSTRAVVLGDVDRDGDLDMVLGNLGQNRLYLNDGSGTFIDATAARMPIDGAGTRAAALGDVDRDGDLDMVLGNFGQNRLYLNDGSGTYIDATAARMPADRDSTQAVALGDIDGDGDVDIVLGNTDYYGAQNRLYVNGGTGTFSDATAARLPAESNGTRAVALADVDADGDLDVVVGNDIYRAGPQNRLYLNLLRQLDAPHLARTGHTFTLEAHAHYGPPSSTLVGLPFLSTATAQIPLPPLGTVGLDPRQLVALPPLPIPQPAGVGSLGVPIPNLPGLIGVSVYAQAVLVPASSPARLTNITADVIVQ